MLRAVTHQDTRYEGLLEAAADARLALLRTWGGSFEGGESHVFAPLIGGALRGLPPWPTREGFRVIRTERTTIVVTDGLSDPFMEGDAVEGLEAFSGFGLEVWIETDDPIEDVPSSWAFALVSCMGYQVADLVTTRPDVDDLGLLAIELHAADLAFDGEWPSSVVSPDGTVGVLLGMRPAARPDVVTLAGGDVRYLSMRLLAVPELNDLRSGGATARAALAAKLGSEPNGWISRLPPAASRRPWWRPFG